MKLKETWDYVRKFYRMIQKDHPTVLFYVILGGILKGFIPYISLYYSSKILDALLASDVELAKMQIMILLASTFLLSCIERACYQSMSVIAESSYYAVWKQTAHKAYVMEYEEFEKTETMDKIRRAKNGSNGSGGVESQISSSYILVSNYTSIFCSLVFTIQLLIQSRNSSNFIIYTIILLLVFIAFMTMENYMQKRLAKIEVTMQRDNEHMNSLSAYIISSALDVQNGKDIRLYRMKDLINYWYYVFNKKINQVFKKYADTAGTYYGIIAFFMQIFTAFVYIYVGLSVLDGNISIGDVLLYTGSITRLSTTFNEAISGYNQLVYRFEYLGNFEEFINSKNMHYEGTLPIEKRDDYQYEFEFKNVSFKYPNTDNYVLKNIDLKLKVNQRLAIVGQNGAGKTTLIKLLCRLYEPSEGEILLNGIDIKKYDYKEYTDIFSVVFQDFKLFPLPLDENIASSSDVDEDKCLEVLNKVSLKEKVLSWPEKQHTRLYKDLGDGVNISGGEAQKIAIARALYKDAPFVIMDEPTAALDPLAEAEIYENLNQLVNDKTAIFISHRMSSCKFCDEIIVFENGEITQRGTHESLLEEEGLYQQLWNAQAQYYV